MAEAFSGKCPVVSTRLGAFGYDVKHGSELFWLTIQTSLRPDVFA